MLRRSLAALLTVTVLGSALVACTGGGMKVSDAWARTSMGMDLAGAAYLVIKNDTGKDDALLGVKSTASAKAELHETKMAADGTMGMSPVAEIPVAAGASATLEPGGLHIMLIDLVEPLVAGEKIELTLTFRQAGEVKVTAEVKES